MASSKFIVPYKNGGTVTRASKSTMGRYLSSEIEAWAEFFEYLEQHNTQLPIGVGQNNITLSHNGLQMLKDLLSDPIQFNRQAERRRNTLSLPPPSSTLEGQLVLGLYSNGYHGDALSAYMFALWSENNPGAGINRVPQPAQRHVAAGDALFVAARAAEVLPSRTSSGRRVAASVKDAEAHVEDILAKVSEGNQLIEAFQETLTSELDAQKERLQSIETLAEEKSSARDFGHAAWQDERVEETKAIVGDQKTSFGSLLGRSEVAVEKQLEKFKAMEDRYREQLRFEATVDLWEQRKSQHETNRDEALKFFRYFIIASIVAALAIPILGGNFIATSFFENLCFGSHPAACERVFNPRGPLLVSGILFFSSILLWVTRMQYRIYLSERHLSLDASERAAFARTYYALKEDNVLDKGSETIVLASLFRPTQDGIVADDQSVVDLSAAAILAKQMR